MKIGQKIALALFGITVTVVGMFIAFQRPVLIDNFRELQYKMAKRNLSRSREAIATEIAAIGRQTQDWGSWDDTYHFVQGKNENFRRVNLSKGIYDTSHMDFIYIVDSKGRVIHGSARLPNGKIVNQLKGFDPVGLTLGTDSKPGPGIDSNATVSGLDSIEGIPTLVFGRPIVDSNESRATMGAIFMGRFLLPLSLKGLSEAVSVPFALETTESVLAGSDTNPISSVKHLGGTFRSRPDTDDDINCYGPIRSTSGPSQFVVRSQTDPDILRDGIATVDEVVRFVAYIAVLAAAFGLLLVHWIVAAPLFRLTTRLSEIGNDQAVDVGSGFVNRNDEIGVLSRHFQEALQRLSTTQTRLMHASREAGMAEVARGVLHNAGNVLNSVTVSVNQLKLMLNQSKISGLGKTVSLMKENDSDLGEFLQNNAKGVQVLPYLTKLSAALEREHDEFDAEVDDLCSLTKHLGDVVQGQHIFATKPNQEIPMQLDKIIRDAIQIVHRAFERNGIKTEFHVGTEFVCLGDPLKLLQVLVNILTNGKEAFNDATTENKLIKISAGYTATGLPEIVFQDNGRGIESEKLTQIFQQGFSTKKSGIGYGLHYCANALAEMGWSIRAESDGLDKGAKFILTGRESLEGEVAA